jgi:hypothetical protein
VRALEGVEATDEQFDAPTEQITSPIPVLYQSGYLTIKSLEAFAKAADGKATKLIIPSELQSLAGLAASAKEIFSADAAEDAEQK